MRPEPLLVALLAGCHVDGSWVVHGGDPNCLVQDGDEIHVSRDAFLSPEPWTMTFESEDIPGATCDRGEGHEWFCTSESTYDLAEVNASARGSSTLSLHLIRAAWRLDGTVSLTHTCTGSDCAAVEGLAPCGTDGSAPIQFERR